MRKSVKTMLASLGMATALGAFAPSAFADAPCVGCSDWVISPDGNANAFSVTTNNGILDVGDAWSATQVEGMFGAGFTVTASSFSMIFDSNLQTWDSYNATNGYWDAFVVTVNKSGYYWNLPQSDPITPSASTWVWGGADWLTATKETYNTATDIFLDDTISLAGGYGTYYVSLLLDTKTAPDHDTNHPSWGTFQINTVAAPIPEPETYAMLLAGLGLMGFVARRRQRNAAA